MQKTIRVLRVALPILGVAFILLIVFSFRRVTTTKEKVDTSPVKTARQNDRANVESKGFEDTQTIAGRIASRISADRAVSHVSGWNTLENVHLTIFRPTGLIYDLSCPTAEYNSKTKEADAKGGVIVKSSDGVDIRTAQIHFDGNHLTNQVPVQFKIDRWQGNAGALDLDVQAETMRLFEKFDATMMPEQVGETPMYLKSHEATFRRREGDVTFTQNVVMTHDEDRVEGDKVLGHFTPDRKTLTGMDGYGHIVIRLGANTQAPGTGELAGGRKEITADRFWTELANGQISAINTAADGNAFAHAVLDGPPKRDIVSRSFRAQLQNKVVTQLKAEGDTVVKEFGEVTREMSSHLFVVYFDPATRKAVSASTDGNFHYKDPKNEGSAIRAMYDIANDRIVLTGQPGMNPTVTSDGNILKAKVIEFSPKAGTAKGTGEVIAQLVSKKDGSGVAADATNMFPAGKPVFVNADGVLMKQAQKSAVFSGNVRAWQETNTLFANELQVQGAGDQMTARGDVRTTLYNASTNPGETARKNPVLSRSDQLYAQKSEHRIELSGNVKIDDDTRHVTGEKSTFFFGAANKIDHIEAEKNVVLTDTATQRRGTGDKITYLVDKKLVYVEGSPATVTDPNGTLNSDKIQIDLVRNKVEAVGTKNQTKGTYKQKP